MNAPARPLLDRGIAAIAPGWALRRARSRFRLVYAERALALATRKHDAGSRGRRARHWSASIAGPNTELWGSLHTIRSRAREAKQNDPWLAGGIEAWVDHAVGKGIQPSFVHAGGDGPLEVCREAHLAWAESSDADPDVLSTYYGLQARAFGGGVESGEAVIMPVYGRRKRGVPQLKIQVREGDYIDHQLNTVLPNGNQIVQGIEYSGGNRVAVWMFDEHPGEQFWGMRSNNLQAKRYSIPDEAVVMMRPERPGQVRGIPWTACVLLRARELMEFEEAQLVQQRIARCYALFISQNDGAPDIDGSPLGGEDEDEMTLEPGMIEHLGPGEKIESHQPPLPHGYKEYQSASLRSIAVGLGLPFEVLTGDYERVNFSSSRSSRNSWNRRLRRVQHHQIVPQFCVPTMRWWLKAAALAGLPVDGLSVRRWIPPRQDMVQPEKDVPANIARLGAGLVSPQQLIRESGEAEPEDVLDELADWKAKAEERGLHFAYGDPEPESDEGAEEGGEDNPPPSDRRVNGNHNGRLAGCLQ